MSAALLPPELGLLIACCRPRPLPDFEAAVEKAAHGDWNAETLLALARAHRVEGFVEDGLRRGGIALPPASAQLLTARATASRIHMLRNAGEEIRLHGLFARHDIPALFVKGATLAMLAHGTLALKTSWDIDMLVAPGDLARARQLLAEAGYRLHLPGINDPRLIERFFLRNKETIWTDATRGTSLELHSALVDAPLLLRDVGMASPVQQVAVAEGRHLPTLAAEPLFAYLCTHGTTHRWERLKWLVDVAALTASGRIDMDSAGNFARPHGADHAVGAAWLLLNQLFGLTSPETRPSRAARRLAALSMSAIAANVVPDPPIRLGYLETVRLFRAQWLQGDTFGARLSVLGKHFDISASADRLAVPDAMLRFHTLLWLPWRLITRPWRRRQSRGGNSDRTP